ncbi:winged helix-turn-helix domain-containing protein [Aeromonas lacus]|uniref:winged helix-turn-helix domain-containing protein n=1 Tax=Aeromonas lacus TaxID=558884 RepID=UPI000A033C7A|nr:winged helix-turn-helix domain-containing protein [Aeromonas lacus]
MVYVDQFTGSVFNGDSVIGHLNQNELAIIKCLIEREGEVVSKDALLVVGWPGRIVVPNSVNMAIRNIRTILTKVTNEPLVVTLPREGYRLLPGVISMRATEEGVAMISSDMTSLTTSKSLLDSHFFRWVKVFYRPVLSLRFIFFSVLVVMLWVGVVSLFRDRAPFHCVEHKNITVCTVDSVSLSQSILENAPSDSGTYIYGIDPVTGEGIYEKKH